MQSLKNTLSPYLLQAPNVSSHKRSILSTALKPLFRKNSNLFSVNPNPSLTSASLSEKVHSFNEYSPLVLNALQQDISEFLFKLKDTNEIIAMLNQIGISLGNLKNFEETGHISENMMAFMSNYLLKLQVIENKFLFFLKVITGNAPDNGIPKKNFYKYFGFIIKGEESNKWMLVIFETQHGNCDIVYPFDDMKNSGIISIAKNTLHHYGLQENSLQINPNFHTEPRNDSGLKILSLLLEMYLSNENLETVKSPPFRKNEILWAIYQFISSQNHLNFRKKSKIVSSQMLSDAQQNLAVPHHVHHMTKRAKPNLKLVIPKLVEKTEKIEKTQRNEKSPYFVASGFPKQSNMESQRKSILKSAVKLPVISQNNSKNNSMTTNERITISKIELKNMLQDMKDSIFEEIEKKNLVRSFVSKEFSSSSEKEMQRFSKNDLKKMLINFKTEFSDSLEIEKRRKKEESYRNQMKMGQLQKALNFFYYYNPEVYESLSKEFSKKMGEYYLEGLFH